MNYYINAYDKDEREVLGNLDGQAAILNVKVYKRTNAYKRLRTLKTLNNRIAFYEVVDSNGRVLETVPNNTFEV